MTRRGKDFSSMADKELAEEALLVAKVLEDALLLVGVQIW